MAIVKSSKNVKRKMLWISQHSKILKKKFAYHQHGKNELSFLLNYPAIYRVNAYSTKLKKLVYLSDTIYSWRSAKRNPLSLKLTKIYKSFIIL